MVHLVLYGLLAVVLGGALFAIAARFLPAGEQIAPPVRDEPPWELPRERAMSPEDVDAIRLPVALRGYRFAETDLLLDRLAGEIAARDQEIARLRGELGEGDVPAGAVSTVPDERLEEELAVDEALEEQADTPAAEHWAAAPPPWAVGPAPEVAEIADPDAPESAGPASVAPAGPRRRRRRRA